MALPVLVADLPNASARDFLTRIAHAGGRAFLPLIAAPAAATTHRLEVYTPGAADPLVLFAEPLGPPTSVGFPLQLRTSEPSSKKFRLSQRRSRDLSGELVEVGPDPLIGRAISSGKLIIKSLVGEGSIGSVYRASHRDLPIQVAVKVLHEHFQADMEFCRRFHAEALAASRLDHPNLVRVLDFGQEQDGLLYLAMQHIDGVPLTKLLVPGCALPLPRIAGIMMQVCAGLAHAHLRGVIHRDIKPDNVMLVSNLDDDGRPDEVAKVCDFGIAVGPTDNDASKIAGTPDYMSPEQCRGDTLDGRSDVYSCGVVLYELATGQMPFVAATPAAMLNRHMHTAPPSPRVAVPDIDPRLEAVIMKALAKEPDDRQPSMRDLRNELRALLEEPRRATPPASAPHSHVRAKSPTTAGAAPDWLERGGGYQMDSVTELSNASVRGRLLATELATRPGPWLSVFAETTRPEAFGPLWSQLDSALPFLIAERNTKALFAIRSTIDLLAVPGVAHLEWRRARAETMQNVFGDPSLLGFLAEQALVTERPAREITELLFRSGTPGAYALYSARLKLAKEDGIRERFIAMVRELGDSALPMIRAGLAKLAPKLTHPVAAALAIDLERAKEKVRSSA